MKNKLLVPFAILLMIGTILIPSEAVRPIGSVTLDQYPTPLNPGDSAVDFALQDFYDDSTSYSLSSFSGKVVLFDLMASWCGPCIATMPDMINLHEAYKTTGEFEIFSIGVDYTENFVALDNFHEKYGVQWPFSQDYFGARSGNATFNSAYGSGYIPTYYLVNQTGYIVFAQVGWAGLDFWYDLVGEHVTSEDTTKPSISSFSDSITDGAELSFLTPYTSFSATATDNWDVKDVTVVLTSGENKVSIPLNRQEDRTVWERDYEFFLSDLVDVSSFAVSYIATDYSGNSFTADGGSIVVTPIVDNEPPKLAFVWDTYVNEADEHYLDLTIGVSDDVVVLAPQLFMYQSCTSEPTEIELTKGSGTSYEAKIEFAVGADLTGYNFMVRITDAGGNLVLEQLEIDGIDTADCPDLYVIPTTSDEVTSFTSSEDTSPINPLFILGMAMMVIIQRRKK